MTKARGVVHTWAPIGVPERDPKVDPQFGDVFEYHIPHPVTGKMAYGGKVMFVAGNLRDWTALDVDDGSLNDGYINVGDPGWEFIEHIDGHATGCFVDTLDRAVAGDWGTAVHHIDGNPANNDPANLLIVEPAVWIDP